VHLAQILLVLLAKASTSATESTVNNKSQIYFFIFSGILDFGKLYDDRDAIFLHLEHVASNQTTLIAIDGTCWLACTRKPSQSARNVTVIQYEILINPLLGRSKTRRALNTFNLFLAVLLCL
jgi:hypothetical protein